MTRERFVGLIENLQVAVGIAVTLHYKPYAIMAVDIRLQLFDVACEALPC